MAAPLKPHKLADIFPLMEGDEFDALVSDIKANGLREPIVLFEEKILDGRNRHRACMQGGIEPKFKTYRGDDPLGYVISLNIERRHLNESQRAMIASDIANMPRGGQSDGSANLPTLLKSQANAAKQVNVSIRSVGSAAAIRHTAEPEIERAVRQGHLTVSLGAKAAKLPKAYQRKIAASAEAGNGGVKSVFHKLEKARDEARVLALAPVAGKFPTLVIDPGWDYAFPDFATMTQEQLLALDVPQWARDDCALYLWTTNNYMPQAAELMAHWGFTHKAVLTWIKPKFGWGTYFRNSTEHVLFGIRGDAKTRRSDMPTHFEAPLGEPCEKPEKFYEIVRAAASYPAYGEIFQRKKRSDFANLYQPKNPVKG
jgi:N6-adenosine-specific RNA methylase IME4